MKIVLLLLLLFHHAFCFNEAEMSFTSPYSRLSGYFIVDGKEILITYRFPGNPLEIKWVLYKSGEVILHATFNESDFSQILDIQSESYKSRIINSTFSVGLTTLQFLVDKEKDEGQLFVCSVKVSPNNDEFDRAIALSNILGRQ